MSFATLGTLLLAFLFGSALTIQTLAFPALMTRITERSAVTRVSNHILQRHHSMCILALCIACILFFLAGKATAGIFSALLLLLNLYQRFWIFTKLHLVKQPIGVQDLIQPDNALREELNRLQKNAYRIFQIHLLLLLIDLGICAF